MIKATGIYLGKAGKTFGPFSEDDFQQMLQSGAASEYTYIWDREKSKWKPLEAPPPSPSPSKSGTSGTTAARGKSEINWDQVEALCYNDLHLVEGRIGQVTETGCRFVSGRNALTPLVCGSAFTLNLYDPVVKKCYTVAVKILSMESTTQPWEYLMRWSNLPTPETKE